MNYLDSLESKLNTAEIKFFKINQKINEEIIKNYQDKLGVKFPPSFIAYLMRYGALDFYGNDFYGVTPSEDDEIPNILFATKSYRADGLADENMVVVKSSGYGPIYSIDTSMTDNKGEAAVVLTEFSLLEGAEKEIVFSSFAEFLTHFVDEAINDATKNK